MPYLKFLTRHSRRGRQQFSGLSVTEAQPDHFYVCWHRDFNDADEEVGAINTRKRLKDNHDIKDISLVTSRKWKIKF
jgi:hypothetical protein